MDIEGLLGDEVHCLVAVDSHPKVVSSFLATWDAWLKTGDVPNYISQPFRAQTWAHFGPLRVCLGAAACRTPVRAGSPSPAFSVEPRVRETGGGGGSAPGAVPGVVAPGPRGWGKPLRDTALPGQPIDVEAPRLDWSESGTGQRGGRDEGRARRALSARL